MCIIQSLRLGGGVINWTGVEDVPDLTFKGRKAPAQWRWTSLSQSANQNIHLSFQAESETRGASWLCFKPPLLDSRFVPGKYYSPPPFFGEVVPEIECPENTHSARYRLTISIYGQPPRCLLVIPRSKFNKSVALQGAIYNYFDVHDNNSCLFDFFPGAKSENEYTKWMLVGV